MGVGGRTQAKTVTLFIAELHGNSARDWRKAQALGKSGASLCFPSLLLVSPANPRAGELLPHTEWPDQSAFSVPSKWQNGEQESVTFSWPLCSLGTLDLLPTVWVRTPSAGSEEGRVSSSAVTTSNY